MWGLPVTHALVSTKDASGWGLSNELIRSVPLLLMATKRR